MKRTRGSLWALGALLAVVLIALGGAILVVGLAALTPLPRPQLPVASVFFDREGNPIARRFEQNRIEIPLAAMPQHLRAAALAAEDHRFYQHRGLDPRGLLRALFRNLTAGQVVEGGSTITQQLARNLYLTHNRTIARKALEAIYALRLERRYTKDEILALYLNTIYLGEGAYGVEVAAQTYLGKPARELTLAESALLVGVARGPTLYNPFEHPEAARSRRDVILGRMAELGYITAAEAEAARAKPLGVQRARPTRDGTDFFRDYVESVIQERYPEVYANLEAGGYRIETTLDPKAQRAAVEALREGLPQARKDEQGVLQPQGALVALDPQSGDILAMVGGRDYANSPYNRAVLARRQPGSAFKPILYATVLSTGDYTAASTQFCGPVAFPAGAGQPPWRPKDFHPDRPYHNRPVAMRDAIRESDNVVAARWMDVVGPDRVIAMAQRLGIESPLRPDLTLSLGSSEVTVLELTRAFVPFANGGHRVTPNPIRRIVGPDGRVVAEPRPQREKVLDERVAFILTDMMREVFRPGGTAGQLIWTLNRRPAAGKTGTTEFTYDAWTVGYTPDLVATVWIGNDSPSQPLPGTGATLAAPVLGRFLATALEGEPFRDFPRPAGLVQREVCRDSGLLATPGCTGYPEWFVAGTEPTQYDPRVLPPLFAPPEPGGSPVPGSPPAEGPPEPDAPGEGDGDGTNRSRFWLPFRVFPRWLFGW